MAKNKYREFQNIISGGMRYEFQGTTLTVTGYWSGNSVSINLGELSKEAFDEIVIDDGDYDDEDEEEDE